VGTAVAGEHAERIIKIPAAMISVRLMLVSFQGIIPSAVTNCTFLRERKAQFVTVGIIYIKSQPITHENEGRDQKSIYGTKIAPA
jgi:hypothetical protein